MSVQAAFFDLDRTIVSGSSSPDWSAALGAVGLAPGRPLPGSEALGLVYEYLGENLLVIALARAAASAARGWSVERATAAAHQAADSLLPKVAPYVRPLLDEHRSAGALAVLATTSPDHLVRPLAARLGFDDVIATRYAERDGRFTGSLVGPFVWGTGKLAAVRAWAGTHGVALADSFAYSDSVYDLPLLCSVGHPCAVHPDPRLRAVALARGWPLRWLDVPAGVPKLGGFEPVDVLRVLSRPQVLPWVRLDVAGIEQIPRSGPAIVVANHRSYFDVAAVGTAVLRAGRAPRFVGKREVFDAPLVGRLATALGGIRVDRGSGSAQPLLEAERALAAGEVIVVMPQGTIPRGEAFFDPVLVGRWGAARLAAATGAPVVPIGLWGTEKVWPRSSRLPNLTGVLRPPTVQIRVGPAVDGLGGAADSLDADTATIMAAIGALLPSEAHSPPTPTVAELARTHPPATLGGTGRRRA